MKQINTKVAIEKSLNNLAKNDIAGFRQGLSQVFFYKFKEELNTAKKEAYTAFDAAHPEITKI